MVLLIVSAFTTIGFTLTVIKKCLDPFGLLIDISLLLTSILRKPIANKPIKTNNNDSLAFISNPDSIVCIEINKYILQNRCYKYFSLLHKCYPGSYCMKEIILPILFVFALILINTLPAMSDNLTSLFNASREIMELSAPYSPEEGGTSYLLSPPVSIIEPNTVYSSEPSGLAILGPGTGSLGRVVTSPSSPYSPYPGGVFPLFNSLTEYGLKQLQEKQTQGSIETRLGGSLVNFPKWYFILISIISTIFIIKFFGTRT